jgi:hypothetical protein
MDTQTVQPVACPKCGAGQWRQIITTRLNFDLDWDWDHYYAREYGEDTSERTVVAYQCFQCVYRADGETRAAIEERLSDR